MLLLLEIRSAIIRATVFEIIKTTVHENRVLLNKWNIQKNISMGNEKPQHFFRYSTVHIKYAYKYKSTLL